jgi:predicted metal-dependent hydrolase
MDRETSRKLIARLNRDGKQIARQFGLRYKSITAERANVKNRYGSCFEDGAIKIRLRHLVTKKPLKYSSLVNTLCHELAHLRYFHHGERFKAFYWQILEYARQQRIYQPTRPGARPVPWPRAVAQPATAPRPTAPETAKPRAPVQLGLF